MYKDFSDSIKARLYDFKYTPFLSSYIFSWLYYNAKLLLIFTSSLTVYKKIEMLSYEDVNFTTPLIIALVYTLIFPLFTLVFYFVTLLYKKNMTKIKQKINNETLLNQVEANHIIADNLKLRDEINNDKIEIEKLNKNIKELNDKLNRPKLKIGTVPTNQTK